MRPQTLMKLMTLRNLKRYLMMYTRFRNKSSDVYKRQESLWCLEIVVEYGNHCDEGLDKSPGITPADNHDERVSAAPSGTTQTTSILIFATLSTFHCFSLDGSASESADDRHHKIYI